MQDSRERWIFALILLSALSTLLSIAAAQIFLGLAVVLWVVLWIAIRPRPFYMPSYILPLCVFMLTTLLSMAVMPAAGYSPIRKFLLYPMGLVAANFITDARRAKLAYRGLLVTAAAGSVVSLFQFAVKERRFLTTHAMEDDPMGINRVKGFMGHWMTFSGGQLLIWCAVIPLIIWLGRRWIVPLSLVGIGLIFSYTRSAWIGAAAGLGTSAFWIPRKQLIRILIPIVVVGVLASPFIYHRIAMSLEGRFGPDYGRAELLRIGVKMVQAHPLFGVGIEQIPVEFPRYYEGGDLTNFYYGHMQNNFMQIAAERGLLCFAAFLWFLVEIYRSLWRFMKSSDETLRLTALSALSALTGFLVMGLFEYNFGDSEPLMLFLFVVSIPFGIHGASIRRQHSPQQSQGS